VAQSTLMGAAPGLANYAGETSYDPYQMKFENNQLVPANYSQAPWADSSPTMTSIMADSNSYSLPASNQSTTQEVSGPTPSFSDKLFQTLGFDGGTPAAFNSNNIGSWAEGLAGLYAGNKQRKMARDMMRSYGTHRGAYEKQLQRQLQRRDAASGRRSDYGGREVALQSALAELDSRNAPSMMNLQSQQLGGIGSMLQTGLRLGSKLGWLPTPSYNAPAQQPGYTGPQSLSSLNMAPVNSSTSLYDQYKKNNTNSI